MIRQGKNRLTPVRLKICGLTRAGDVAHCLARGVAFVGFNVYRGSKRYVEPATARDLWLAARASAAPGSLTTRAVAVVVDPSLAELEGLLAAFPELAAVQFHGAETPAALLAARSVLGRRESWKAVGIGARADVQALPQLFAGACDLILLDNARIPPGAAVMGGSGQAFDWGWIDGYEATLPFGVAGGVNPDNVAELAAHAGVGTIDVSSGVESAPGIKDPHLVDALCRIIAT
jgi:phosphoribosylanthranilate isomerase